MTLKKTISIIVFVLILLALLAGGYYFWKQYRSGADNAAEATVSEEAVSEDAAAEGSEASAQTKTAPTIDAKAALSDRILGDPKAPIKISEHSSFTCGHCGNFHRTVFAEFKKNWIDSGKAYLVFSDFPLNAPALHASIIARCLPEDQYFDYTDMLFETQDKWAYNVAYLDYLKSEAAKRGLDGESFTACLQNGDIQKGILDRVRVTQSQWSINSTPSFVVNNEHVIHGSSTYEEFNAAIEKALNVEPETPETPETNVPEVTAPEIDAPEDSAVENSPADAEGALAE